MAPAMRVCKGCRKVFTPQYSDDQLKTLFYDDESIEKVEFLQAEYPGFMGVPQLNVRGQILCDKCTNDPELEPIVGFLGSITFRKKAKKEKKQKK